jgi:hypothetical protein
MLISADPLPYAFEAVIVYGVEICVPVGVPLIAQDVELIDKPAGKLGALTQFVSGVPVRVGAKSSIAAFITKEYDAEE